MSKKFSQEDIDAAVALSRTSAALQSNRDKRRALRDRWLTSRELEETARIEAWGRIGRVTFKGGDPNDLGNYVTPKGWPPPYRDYEHWLRINLEGWDSIMSEDGGQTTFSETDKHLKAFREAIIK